MRQSGNGRDLQGLAVRLRPVPALAEAQLVTAIATPHFRTIAGNAHLLLARAAEPFNHFLEVIVESTMIRSAHDPNQAIRLLGT